LNLKEEILLGKEGEVQFLLGNEAVVRGLYEAGVGVAATYPGTPSSEIGDILYKISGKMGIKFEFSTNEKVALEVAAAASESGERSFVFMKHVGLNVAMDSFVSLAGTGVKSGMVILSADDPSMHSSQNEQDNRFLGKFAKMIVIEPSSPQELKDFIVKAFDISEEIKHPVLIRSVTRVSHVRAPVKFSKVREKSKGKFIRDPSSLVLLPENAYAAQKKIRERLDLFMNKGYSKMFNVTEGNGDDLIITSGSSFNYIQEAAENIEKKFRVMKIGASYPLDMDAIEKEIINSQKVIFIEEGGPLIEEQVLSWMAIKHIDKDIYGKLNGKVPESYEMDVDRVSEILAGIYGIDYKNKGKNYEMPQRPPALCPGCPHRATYYVAKIALRQKGIKNFVAPTDIGCYTLGYYEPYSLGDFLLSMGSSVGSANGFTYNVDGKVVAFIGDSTFFHAGIPALINAYHNNHNFLLVILDNSTTAMTGGQPTPEHSEGMRKVDIRNVVKAIGIENIYEMDPYDLNNSLATFKKALDSKELSVIISKRDCALEADRIKTQDEIKVYEVNQDKCKLCYNCVKNFACAAFYIEDGKVKIDPELCDGCSVCSEPLVCPFNAIEVRQQ